MKNKKEKLFAALIVLILSLLSYEAYTGHRTLTIIHMAWAKEKTGETFTTDSTLRKAVAYCDNPIHFWLSPSYRIQSHYLLGCAHRDLGEIAPAIETWEHGIEVFRTFSMERDYTTIAAMYARLAEAYGMLDLMEQRLQALDNLAHFSLLAGDTAACNHARIAHELTIIHQAVGSLHFVRAGKLMEKVERGSWFPDIYGVTSSEHATYYLDKGKYYLGILRLDSAELWLRHSMTVEELRQDALYSMIRLWAIKPDTDSLTKYVLQLDSIDTTWGGDSRVSAGAQAMTMLNYSRHQREISTREKAIRRMRVSVFGIIVATVACMLYYRYRQRTHEREMKRIIDDYMRTRRELTATKREVEVLRGSMPHLQQVQQMLDEKECRIAQLERLLDNYKTHIGHTVPENDNEALMQSDIVILLRHICQMQIHRVNGVVQKEEPRACTESEWHDLMRAVQTYHYSLYYALTMEKRLPRLQLRVCILSRLGFYVSEIACLLATTTQNVSNARSRAAKRLFDSSDTSLLDSKLIDI